MTREDQIQFCKICVNRNFDLKKGIVCSLTMEQADFEDQCPNFELNELTANQELLLEQYRSQIDLEQETAGLSEFGITSGKTAGIIIMVLSGLWFSIGMIMYEDPSLYGFVLFIVGLAVYVKAKS